MILGAAFEPNHRLESGDPRLLADKALSAVAGLIRALKFPTTFEATLQFRQIGKNLRVDPPAPRQTLGLRLCRARNYPGQRSASVKNSSMGGPFAGASSLDLC
jgi:hypothetical protein